MTNETETEQPEERQQTSADLSKHPKKASRQMVAWGLAEPRSRQTFDGSSGRPRWIK